MRRRVQAQQGVHAQQANAAPGECRRALRPRAARGGGRERQGGVPCAPHCDFRAPAMGKSRQLAWMTNIGNMRSVILRKPES